MFHAWGLVVYRFRWLALAASSLMLLISIGSLLLAPAPSSLNSNGTTESARAETLVTAQLPQTPSRFQLIFSSAALDAHDPAFQAAVESSLAPLYRDSRVASIETPYGAAIAEGEAALFSKDGHEVIAIVTLTHTDSAAQNDYQAVRQEVRSTTLTVTSTGGVAIDNDFASYLRGDLTRTSFFVFAIALVLLVAVFGSIVAAGLPLLIAVAAEVTGIALGVNALGHFTDVSQYASDLIALIGLGVAIDYSLFIVSRFREELRVAPNPQQALAQTMATAGRAIVFSGLTVAVGLLGLLFYQGSFVASMGAAGALAVLAAVTWAVFLLPSLLAILGRRVNTGRLPWLGGTPKHGRGAFGAVALFVMRHPRLILGLVACGLVITASPVFDLQLRTTGIEGLPPQAPSRVGLEKLHNDFAASSINTVVVVVAFGAGDPGSVENTNYLSGLRRDLGSLPGAIHVDESLGSHIAVETLSSHDPVHSPNARSMVESIRSLHAPPGVHLLVGGATASNMDDIAFVLSRTPAAVAFVAVATCLVLFLLLGSVVLPLKALITNLLSISASFGAVVFLFQWGNLSGELDFTPQPVDPFILALLFAVIFGLSMDYEVFMLSRIQEHYRRTLDTTAAVAAGLETSGRLITGAAAIMVGVFLAFGLIANTIVIKEIGIGLGVAVILDATVARILLVPAAMRVLGRANWWAPRGMSRLYRRLSGIETAALDSPRAEETSDAA